MEKESKKRKKPRGWVWMDDSPSWNGNWLRLAEFKVYRHENNKGLLPYPYEERKVGEDTCLVYKIPRSELQAALNAANSRPGEFFYPINRAKIIPTGDGKRHRFSTAKIIHYQGYNHIVPPQFFTKGWTAWGWAIYRYPYY